jgi:hypothetical protein
MFIDLACCLGRIVGGGEARGDVSDRRAVGGEGVELSAARLLDLGDAPVGGACRTQSHDEGDGRPEVVNRGAAQLVGIGEGAHEGRPLALHGAEVGLAGDLLVEGGGSGGGGTPGAGQRAAALEWLEVLALGEGEEHLVAEGNRGSVVKEGGDSGVLACLVELGPLLGFHAGRGIKGEVHVLGKLSSEVTCISMRARFLVVGGVAAACAGEALGGERGPPVEAAGAADAAGEGRPMLMVQSPSVEVGGRAGAGAAEAGGFGS